MYCYISGKYLVWLVASKSVEMSITQNMIIFIILHMRLKKVCILFCWMESSVNINQVKWFSVKLFVSHITNYFLYSSIGERDCNFTFAISFALLSNIASCVLKLCYMHKCLGWLRFLNDYMLLSSIIMTLPS